MALLSNIPVPDVSGDRLKTGEKIDLLVRYMNNLTRQLMFVLENIESENLSDSLKAEISSAGDGIDAVTHSELAPIKVLLSGAVWKHGTIDGETVWYLSKE